MRISRHVTAAAIATALASTAVVVATPASAAPNCTTTTEVVTDPATGEKTTGQVTECNTQSMSGRITSWPASGTGGLNIRNEYGAYLGSGIGESQTFEFIKCGPSGSGLIYVKQLTRGEGGGWGALYKGYVNQRWTQIPGMFPCNGHDGF